MKKLLLILLSLNLVCLPVYSVITDDLAQNLNAEEFKIKPAVSRIITDDFVEQTLDKNLETKKTSKSIVVDDFAEANKAKNAAFLPKKEVMEILPEVSAKQKIQPKKFDYNSENKVAVRIKQNLTTKSQIDEGDYIEFVTLNEVKINNKVYKSGSIVDARIENISLNKSMGVPADILVGNFSIDGNPLSGQINKIGANRSLWVYPCAYIMLGFFGAGLLFLPIRGGHAKINKNQIYTLYASEN